MNRPVFLILAIIVACALLAPGPFLHSLVRGAGWGIGREAAHSIFHGRF